MKPKDIIGLVIAVGFLFGAGYLLLNQNKPKGAAASKGTQVEIVEPISSQFDPNGLFAKLDTTYKVRDFKQPVDSSTGLSNPAPFGQ